MKKFLYGNMSLRFVILNLFFSLLLIACDHKPIGDDAYFSKQIQDLEKLYYSNYDSLLQSYQQLEAKQATLNSFQIQFLKSFIQGQLYFRQGDYTPAIKKLDQALVALVKIPNSDSLKALVYNAKGVNFMSESRYDSAIVNFQRTKDLYERLNQPKKLQKTQVNLAQLYYDKGDFNKCIVLIDSIIKNPLNQYYEMKAIHLKANIMGSQGQIDSAIALDYKVLYHNKTKVDKSLVSMIYNNLALCYLNKNNLDSALHYCYTSYAIDSTYGNEMNMAANLSLIAEIYERQKGWKMAEYFYQKSMAIFTKNQNNDKKLALFKHLKKVYQNRAEFSKVIEFQDSIQHLEAQINGLQLNRSIELLNIEYETNQKNQQLENQQLKLRIQRLILWGLLLLLFILIPLLVLYFKMKNRQTELKLIQQEQRLWRVADEAEQNERKRIAGDLHDSVSQKLAVAKMRLSMLDDEKSPDKTNIEILLDESIREVRNISHNLAPKDLENGLLSSINSLVEQLNYSQKQSKIRFETQVKDEDLKIQNNISLFIYRILQETLHNALKHAEAQNIIIQLSLNKSALLLRIIDDGKGFDKEKMNQFTGLGIKNLHHRVEQMHGKIHFETAPNKGTQINILLNLSHE
jgi:signal transduction histidine kinase